jgi:hypothetical protein
LAPWEIEPGQGERQDPILEDTDRRKADSTVFADGCSSRFMVVPDLEVGTEVGVNEKERSAT